MSGNTSGFAEYMTSMRELYMAPFQFSDFHQIRKGFISWFYALAILTKCTLHALCLYSQNTRTTTITPSMHLSFTNNTEHYFTTYLV